MGNQFKPNKYDNGEKPIIINLTRKQVLQMSEMVERFKDVNDFELHIDNSSGTGTAMNFKFTLDLAGGKESKKVEE